MMLFGSIAATKLLEGLIVVVMLTVGQVFFKYAATAVGSGRTAMDFVLTLMQTGWFWIAIVVYGVATLLWIHMLTKYSLSTSHGILALSYAIVPLVGMVFLEEPFKASVLLAVGCILVGIMILITQS